MKDKNKFDEEDFEDLDSEEEDLDKEFDEEGNEKDGWSSPSYDEE
ncbi:MAG: hypothetical protein WC796_01880 [Candidatus Pacearchaeota archaeon]|jgi:hypothetical protein